MRASKPITVTLGDLQDKIDARIKSGRYANVSEVIRAGLRALDREEEGLDAILLQRVQEALDDPRPAIPADQVFADLHAHHAGRMKAAKRGV